MKKKKQRALIIPDDLVNKTFPDIEALSVDDLGLTDIDDFAKDIPGVDDLAKNVPSIDDLLTHDVICPKCGHKFKSL
jgi:hypothetical protein